MATPIHDKYFLKSLHEEIDLFDRKLAHMEKYDTFASEAERKASASKMAAKRETLARTARQLVNEGIEFKPSELPRSFRTGDEISVSPEEMAGLQENAAVAPRAASLGLRSAAAGRRSLSPFAGTVLDGQAAIADYKRARTKPGVPQA